MTRLHIVNCKSGEKPDGKTPPASASPCCHPATMRDRYDATVWSGLGVRRGAVEVVGEPPSVAAAQRERVGNAVAPVQEDGGRLAGRGQGVEKVAADVENKG